MKKTDKAAQGTWIEEVILQPGSGTPMLVVNSLLILATIGLTVYASILLAGEQVVLGTILLVGSLLYYCILGPILYMGLRVVRPNEAAVLTLFGRYIGTIKSAGFYFVHPFSMAVPSPLATATTASFVSESMQPAVKGSEQAQRQTRQVRRISLKTMTLNNDRQKINDRLGNPINIGIVVIWRVVNTALAAFNVENYVEYLSIQCDSSLRNIGRLYPYDASDDDNNEKSLRSSSQEIAERLREEIQTKVDDAGLQVVEARITHLAYAPEIAAAMLQRQQASAVVDARQLIVEGAVGMVEMALEKLKKNGVVELDEERKAAMVSNLLVVLCGNRDAQPVVNSGSIY